MRHYAPLLRQYAPLSRHLHATALRRELEGEDEGDMVMEVMVALVVVVECKGVVVELLLVVVVVELLTTPPPPLVGCRHTLCRKSTRKKRYTEKKM